MMEDDSAGGRSQKVSHSLNELRVCCDTGLFQKGFDSTLYEILLG